MEPMPAPEGLEVEVTWSEIIMHFPLCWLGVLNTPRSRTRFVHEFEANGARIVVGHASNSVPKQIGGTLPSLS